jgi:hypothetical protein
MVAHRSPQNDPTLLLGRLSGDTLVTASSSTRTVIPARRFQCFRDAPETPPASGFRDTVRARGSFSGGPRRSSTRGNSHARDRGGSCRPAATPIGPNA